MLALIIQLVSGAVGGNVAGNMLKQYDLGTLGNSIAGILGGGIGGQLLGLLVPAVGAAAAGGGTDVGSILAQIAGGGIGGSVLLVIVGVVKQMMMRGADVK
jgi:hypothetical protein